MSKVLGFLLGALLSAQAWGFDTSSSTTQYCGTIAGTWPESVSNGTFTLTQDSSGNIGGTYVVHCYNLNTSLAINYNVSGTFNFNGATFSITMTLGNNGGLGGGPIQGCPSPFSVNNGYIPLHDNGCSEAHFPTFGDLQEVACAIPSSGTTTFDSYTYGTAQFTETINPSSFNWGGRTITETFSNVVNNTCAPVLTLPAGSTWYPSPTTSSSAILDYVGFPNVTIPNSRRLARSFSQSNGCGITLTQTMSIDCPARYGVSASYQANSNKLWINGDGTITLSRNAVATSPANEPFGSATKYLQSLLGSTILQN